MQRPDEVTISVCRWLISGGEPGTYSGPDPGVSHELSALLSREIGRKELILSTTAEWVRMEEILSPVLDMIYADGSEVWAAKGFDLAGSIYPFPGARPMCDVDLFVENRNRDRILNKFYRAGWSKVSPGDGIFSAGIVSEMKLIRYGVLVELHTHMFYFPAVFPGNLPSDLFENGRPLRPGLIGFSWHNALLAVLVHMLTNEFLRPVWWVDVCLLCKKVSESGSWKPFVWNAFGTELGNPIAQILKMAVSDLNVPVPERVTEILTGARRGRDGIIDALKSGRKIPSLLNLKYLTGWKKISWSYALLWLVLSRQHPIRRQ